MNKVTFVEQDHKYFNEKGEEVPSVSSILEWFGISDWNRVRQIQGDDRMEHAAAAGKEIHRICALDDLGQLKRGTWNPEFTPWLNAWRKYREEHRPKFMAIEEPLLSETWGFAGTPDRVEDCVKWLNCGDIKSGVVTRAESLQTALYAILIEENYGVKVKDRFSVHLSPDKYKIVLHKDKGEINVAKSLLVTYNYQKKLGVFDGRE